MKLTVRAHDTGANSVSGLLDRLETLGVDGAQLVCYKILEDIPYVPGAITAEKAAAIGKAFAQSCGSVLGLEAASTHTCYDVQTLQKARKLIGGKSRVILDLVNLMDADNQYNYMDVLKEALDTFGDDILLFHIKDCKRENGKHPRIVPVGTGEMDYAEILGAIKKWNPNAVLTLEETPNAYLDSAVKMIKETWQRV